jgi:hypothetical protein
MIARFLIAAALAASLTAATAAAQSAADLLQKGIYTQETAGDADAAIQIFRQTIGSPEVPRPVAAQAQAHIVDALLQKGDMAGAGRAFGKLARDYADQEDLVNAAGQRLHTIAENGPTLVLGAFQDGKYHHYWTGVEITAPPDWYFRGQTAEPSGDGVHFVDSISKRMYAFVSIRRQNTPPAKIAGRLLERLQSKVANQRRISAGYVAYRLRPESVQRRTIGGHQAWSAVADYVDANGEKMNEYLTFIDSEKTSVFVSVRAAAPDFPSAQSRFEPAIATALIP